MSLLGYYLIIYHFVRFFSNTGQPEAAARQAFAPVLSFLPSFNEVQQRPILAIDVAIDSKPAGECDCVLKM